MAIPKVYDDTDTNVAYLNDLNSAAQVRLADGTGVHRLVVVVLKIYLLFPF